jgi:hypothetical protein
MEDDPKGSDISNSGALRSFNPKMEVYEDQIRV